MNVRSSSARAIDAPGDPTSPAVDSDALDALAWIENGMPETLIGYGPDAPQLTEAQCKEFERASYVRRSLV